MYRFLIIFAENIYTVFYDKLFILSWNKEYCLSNSTNIITNIINSTNTVPVARRPKAHSY